jgi:hypothetical protein
MEKRGHIKTRTSHQEGQTPPGANIIDCSQCRITEIRNVARLLWRKDIEDMMWNAPSLGFRKLCRTDIEFAIHLYRIYIYYLPTQTSGEFD